MLLSFYLGNFRMLIFGNSVVYVGKIHSATGGFGKGEWSSRGILSLQLHKKTYPSLGAPKSCEMVPSKLTAVEAQCSVLGGGAHFIREVQSSDFVEAQAVIHALRFASLKGLKKVIIECDAFAVVNKLKSKLLDLSMLDIILEEAKQLMNSFEDVRVCYIHRLGNRVAHALASFGFDCNEPFTFDSSYPDFIDELVRDDSTEFDY
ncbi:hypothetical protein V6N13_103176 [Hibiscus sabdariffa]